MAGEIAALLVPAALLALAEGFAGQKLVIDERLLLPVCPALAMAWAAPGGPQAVPMVEVRCDAPAWRVFLPVADGAKPPVADGQRPPLVAGGRVYMVDAPGAGGGAGGEAGGEAARLFRRGERVNVLVRGQGFSVSLEAVAEGPARDGRLWVKTMGAGGRRLLARLEADGTLTIDGLNGAVNGR
jgi:hypothetical protein